MCATRRGTRKWSSKYLASCVDDFSCKVLVLVADHLAEGVLDGRVVALDEMAVDELNRQARLAYNMGCVYVRISVWFVFLCPVPDSCTTRVRARSVWLGARRRTYRRLCCPQWQSCVAWAPASCWCWPVEELECLRCGPPEW